MQKERKLMNTSPSCKKRLLISILALVALYAGAAVFPYAFPPACEKQGMEAHLFFSREPQRAAILESGEEALWGRLYLIDHARERICLSSYLFACDDSGRVISAALLRAADRGVQVDILVDGLIGQINFSGSALPYALGTHENIRIGLYNPPSFFQPQALNARLHDKYLVADETCMILGGRNISDEFLVEESHPSYNADRDVMLFSEKEEDCAAGQLACYFNELWQGEYVQPAYETGGNAEEIAAEKAACRALLQRMEGEKESRYASMEADDFAVPVSSTELICNPVQPCVKEPVVFTRLCELMQGAKERVRLQSPYFVLNGAMQRMLEQAVSGPAEVTFYTNSAASGNNLVASADTLWQKGRVLSLNARMYEVQTPYSMHTKSMLVDGQLSVFGSFNFDMRSAYIDTEVMLVVESRELNERLAGHMDAVEQNAIRVTENGVVPDDAAAMAPMNVGKQAAIWLLSPVVFLIRYLL